MSASKNATTSTPSRRDDRILPFTRELGGVAWLAIAADGRWSATKAVVETLALGLVLLLVAVARAWEQFATSRPLTRAYVGGLVGTLAALAVWFVWTERQLSELSRTQDVRSAERQD